MTEWSNVVDCKSTGASLPRFESWSQHLFTVNFALKIYLIYNTPIMGKDRNLQALAPILEQIAKEMRSGNPNGINKIHEKLKDRFKELADNPNGSPPSRPSQETDPLEDVVQVLRTAHDVMTYGGTSHDIAARVTKKSKFLKRKL